MDTETLRGTVSTTELSNLLWALAQLKLMEKFQPLAARVTDLLLDDDARELKTHNVCAIMWAHTQAEDAFPEKVFTKCCETCTFLLLSD